MQVHSFLTVYCMNFIVFFCVTIKLFSLSFVPLLAPNPGDASVAHPTEIWVDHGPVDPTL